MDHCTREGTLGLSEGTGLPESFGTIPPQIRTSGSRSAPLGHTTAQPCLLDILTQAGQWAQAYDHFVPDPNPAAIHLDATPPILPPHKATAPLSTSFRTRRRSPRSEATSTGRFSSRSMSRINAAGSSKLRSSIDQAFVKDLNGNENSSSFVHILMVGH